MQAMLKAAMLIAMPGMALARFCSQDEAQAQGHEHASARLAAVFLQLAREAQSSCFGNMQVSRQVMLPFPSVS